jgi:hypothetical protein
MPSRSLGEYNANLIDVHRLILAHRRESGANRGRRGLGHLTRGGLLLLCAAWERYTESVVTECAEFLCSRLPVYAGLPPNVRKRVLDHANDNRNTWTPAQLQTAHWRTIYLETVQLKVGSLNTPKHDNLKSLFNAALGLSDISAAWTRPINFVDGFVTLRGEVAHRGRQSQYVRFAQLEAYEVDVTSCVIETDNYLCDFTSTLVVPPRRPWRRSRP